MNNPTVAMIGAGAMGGVIAGALVRAGVRVTIIDTDDAHAAALDGTGILVENFDMETPLPVSAVTAPEASGWADLAVIMTPAYETAAAARTAAAVLRPAGAAVSLQNGLGNAETLVDALGAERVFMGSTRCSAERPAPGRPRLTKLDPTVLGELDGQSSARTAWLADALARGGMPTAVTDNVTGVLWSKFIHNCCINAPSAITGLRMGEVTRVEGLGALRWEIAEEALAVARAKGIRLEYPDPIPPMRAHVWRKFTKPSMQQHVEQARPIEIDAINGWLVAEAARLGIDVPINRTMAALARGRAAAAIRDAGPQPDYAAMTRQAEEEVARGETPWQAA